MLLGDFCAASLLQTPAAFAFVLTFSTQLHASSFFFFFFFSVSGASGRDLKKKGALRPQPKANEQGAEYSTYEELALGEINYVLQDPDFQT